MNWSPFKVASGGSKGDLPRSLKTPEGIGDRLRSAAFAEFQASKAFLWAAETFEDASENLKKSWISLAKAEQRHLSWLLSRMSALQIEVQEREVSLQLWNSLQSCKTAREFALYMASAEERGKKAGFRFCEALKKADPLTSEIFKKIAEEEIAHITLAYEFFPAQ